MLRVRIFFASSLPDFPVSFLAFFTRRRPAGWLVGFALFAEALVTFTFPALTSTLDVWNKAGEGVLESVHLQFSYTKC